jgi:DNA-binding protein HU-beta
VNKGDLVDHVAGELMTSRLQASRVIESVLSGIEKGLRDDESVTLTGFGTFEVRPRKARNGRNPHTGEVIRIAEGKRVGFRVGKALRQAF